MYITTMANISDQHPLFFFFLCKNTDQDTMDQVPSAPTLGVLLQNLWQIEPGLVELIRNCVFLPLAARLRHGGEVPMQTRGRERESFKLPPDTTTAWAVAFHPSGEQLAVGNDDRCVRICKPFMPCSSLHKM